jgi:hypothetical protein
LLAVRPLIIPIKFPHSISDTRGDYLHHLYIHIVSFLSFIVDMKDLTPESFRGLDAFDIMEKLDEINKFVERKYIDLQSLFDNHYVPLMSSLVKSVQTEKYTTASLKSTLMTWYTIWLRYTTNVDFLLDGFTEGCSITTPMYTAVIVDNELISFSNEEKNSMERMNLSTYSVNFVISSYERRKLYFPKAYEKINPQLEGRHEILSQFAYGNLNSNLDALRRRLLTGSEITDLNESLYKKFSFSLFPLSKSSTFDFRSRRMYINGKNIKLHLEPTVAVLDDAKAIANHQQVTLGCKNVIIYQEILTEKKQSKYPENISRKRKLMKGLSDQRVSKMSKHSQEIDLDDPSFFLTTASSPIGKIR